MAIVYSATPSTCTAAFLSGWSDRVDFKVGSGTGNIRKTNARTELRFAKELAENGFYRSFKMVYAFITEEDQDDHQLNKLLEKLGFDLVFEGEHTGNEFHPGAKSDAHYPHSDSQRHEETGSLFLYATTPEKYQTSVEAYIKELEDEINRIDPPKKPDPARQAFPDLKRDLLIRAGILQKNTRMDNGVHAVLNVSSEVAFRHIKLTYGIDIKKWKNQGDNWTRLTIRQLKEAHRAWKDEPVIG